MSLNLNVLYDTLDNGKRVVIASLPDPELLPDAEEKYGTVAGGNVKRSIERYGSLILTEQLFPGAIINHGTHGEPLLIGCDQFHEISVSHTADKIAIIFSNENTGIDIENTERYMGRVAGRFLSEKERALTGESGLVAAWCAKEAFYKYIKGQDVTFLNEFSIINFSHGNITIEFKGSNFDIVHITIGDLTLAYI